MSKKRLTIDWPVFITSILLVLSLVATFAYAMFGPRVPWPSIGVFYVWDYLVALAYGLARIRSGGDRSGS
ncbi:hypothetical protein [Schaalia hyovaginalis]|uniref:hypothetical protein n=1 Tax=Schaalia hyovaginalis TaxID=29316 RepID=UPI0026E995FF|nr:hypothetical protein [Schaalia hyovaginalis]MCI6410742.1 hypothetical protein [Schaalia hyovaginalis]MCI6557105.1 hypothetical protein [Schaalia hyovaginalis]MDY3666438.1 hypothetical protein [Schaalia hyovaginalis]MDY4491891.1 hypothetical protein [Schaalia hyovaginalis]